MNMNINIILKYIFLLLMTGKDRTLFLRLLEAEKNGLIVITIDPPMMSTSTGWEKDPSPFLLDARFAQQVTLLSYHSLSYKKVFLNLLFCLFANDFIFLIFSSFLIFFSFNVFESQFYIFSLAYLFSSSLSFLFLHLFFPFFFFIIEDASLHA